MTPRQHTLNVLKFSRQTTVAFFDGIPDDKMTYQSAPTDNHPLWTMGHIAATDAWFGGVLGIKGCSVPPEWNAIFGMHSAPTADSAVYPPVDQVRERFETNRQLILEWLEGASEAQLAIPLSEKTGGFALDPIDFLLKGAWHDGWHTGQLASLRKALGLPRIIG